MLTLMLTMLGCGYLNKDYVHAPVSAPNLGNEVGMLRFPPKFHS